MRTASGFCDRTTALPRHIFPIRLVHLLFAAAIIAQLLTSLVMRPPRGQAAPDIFFRIHEYTGLGALVVAGAFWFYLVVRKAGTDFAALVPWLSAGRMQALWTDMKSYARPSRLRSLLHERESPLASAIQGAGLIIMSVLAISGAITYVAAASNGGLSSVGSAALAIHKLLANFAWAYLIGHAGMALLHEFFGTPLIAEMFSLRRAEQLRVTPAWRPSHEEGVAPGPPTLPDLQRQARGGR